VRRGAKALQTAPAARTRCRRNQRSARRDEPGRSAGEPDDRAVRGRRRGHRARAGGGGRGEVSDRRAGLDRTAHARAAAVPGTVASKRSTVAPDPSGGYTSARCRRDSAGDWASSRSRSSLHAAAPHPETRRTRPSEQSEAAGPTLMAAPAGR
jgi:hypothetical protein